ncbi:MAG: hypothetical protein U0326_13710 [Polyangiales bacterium]
MRYAPSDRLSQSASTFVVVGVVGVGLALWIVTSLVRAWREYVEIRRARESLADPAQLREGPALVEGKVVLASGDRGAAVSLTVVQEGRRAGAETHTAAPIAMQWTEVERTVHVRPFYLSLRGGRSLRVEPAGRVELLDELELPEALPTRGRLARRRRARLTRDERVVIRGALERGFDPETAQSGYRGPAEVLVLRPCEGVMSFSTERLGARSIRRARVHLRAALVGVVALVAMNGLWFREFLALRQHGRVVDARVVSRERVDDPLTNRHGDGTLDLALPTGAMVRVRVNADAYENTREGDFVPVTVASRRPDIAQVGRGEVGLRDGEAIVALLIVASLVLWHALSLRAAKAWYERDGVVDYE